MPRDTPLGAQRLRATQDPAPTHRDQPPTDSHLSGNLGTGSLVFTALAYNAPLAVVVGQLPVIISFSNGAGAELLLVFAGVTLSIFATGFITMSRHLAKPGGFYAMIAAGLGRPPGLAAAFLAVVSYYVMLLGCYAFGGIALQALVHDTFHGPDIAWWAWVLVLQVMAGFLGYFRLDLSARVLTTLLVCEVIVVVIYDAFVVFQGGADGLGLPSLAPNEVVAGSMGVCLLFCFTMFGGFESTVIFRDEVRDPDRTIPRATYLVIGFVTTAYAFGLWVFSQAYGLDKVVSASSKDPTGASLSSIGTYVGQVAVDVTTILLTTSIFAAVLSTHNVSTRYIYNLGADKILPESLSRVHGRHGSPYRASMAVSLLSLVGIAAVTIFQADAATLYARLLGIYGYTLIILLLLTSIAIPVYLNRNRPAGATQWRLLYAPIIAIGGLSIAAYLGTRNFQLLVTGSDSLATSVLVAIYGVGLVGGILALIYRRMKPDTYARIGRL